ncbi:hypothetical protein [Parafilimonas sp.]|uniref:hypothetical protein n=1 Tax=Parafilimonas sp. TaxID=1969739 RepID=UPI0039E2EBA7
MQKLNKNQIFFTSLFLIILVYILYGIYFDLTSVPNIPGKWKHANKFLFVLIIYGTGSFALKQFTVKWMMQVWHLIHVIFIFILLVIGLYDWIAGGITGKIRNVANALFEFLISPALYVCMGIIQFRLFRNRED